MSFILDALKKSETERQQQNSAEFSGVPTSDKAVAVPRWLWIVGILLLVNLTVLVGMLLWPESNPARPLDTAVSTQPISPNDAPTANFRDQVALAQKNPPQSQTELAPDRTVVAKVEPVVISRDESATQSADILPTIHEVRASGAIDLPELHLDIHVFSVTPKDRFVFINTSKHREGSQLSEGPVVAEITPLGVVLGHEGHLFLLPRE